MQQPSIFCIPLTMQVEIHVFIAFQIHWTGTKPFDIFQGQVMTSQSGGIWPPTVGNWQNHFCLGTKLHQRNTIDGRNPAITSWGKGSLSHYLQSLLHPRSLAGFLPSTLSRDSFCASTSKLTFCVRLERDTGNVIPFQGWDWNFQSWEGDWILRGCCCCCFGTAGYIRDY